MASMRGVQVKSLAVVLAVETQLGVRTTKAVRDLGCSNLKQIIETDKLIITDYDLINEFSTFILKGQSFEAEEGHR